MRHVLCEADDIMVPVRKVWCEAAEIMVPVRQVCKAGVV